jgi:hypothetical protein
MPYQSPWEPENLPKPKSITISGSADARANCRSHFGTHDVDPDETVVEARKRIRVPPYHPNCYCTYRIEYRGATGYMTEDQCNAVLAVFESMTDHYISNSRWGPADNLLIMLAQFRDEDARRARDIVNKIREGFAKSCASRAYEMKLLFESHLRSLSHGTRGCRVIVESRQEVLDDEHGPGLPHAWVRFHYVYFNSAGDIVRGSKKYDPWLGTNLDQLRYHLRPGIPQPTGGGPPRAR